MERKQKPETKCDVIPLFGRDEMNLIEFPFGPINGNGKSKTYVVDHPLFDRKLNKEVLRKLIITGSDAFGLPKPVDERVLMGLKALTYQAGFSSRTVEFTRYQLCQVLDWPCDGRTYVRIEESLDRIAGTTLKFKDSWWDKGDELWTSQTFHLIDNVSIATRAQMERARLNGRNAGRHLCYFTWNEVVWKSFEDGYIKKLDMEMYRKIGKGRRKDVPLRLYRILDKRLYRKTVTKFDLRKLCIGIIGLNESYCPRHMLRILERAAEWLVECGFIREMKVKQKGDRKEFDVVFIKASAVTRRLENKSVPKSSKPKPVNKALQWFRKQSDSIQESILENALRYAKESERSLFDGYHRNKTANPESSKGYRDMIVSRFLESKFKQKNAHLAA